ncbi:MAG: LPP20 family lipoprotein [Geopsychrobacter sp.]|nr:LPP20 family lipoprotein [Geopsychrobacter sp.]
MMKFLLILLLLLSTGCTGPVVPDWVNSEPVDYPASRYLIGRGEGDTAGLARDRARADLAKVFQVAVREISRDRLQWQQGGGHEGLQSSVSRNISSHTSQVIRGVQIGRIWRPAKGNITHALAVLDRVQARQLLRAEIENLDAETAQNISRARGEETLPEKISAAYNALFAQLNRQHPQKMLQIVDVTGRGLPSPYALAKLSGDLEALLDRWQIGLLVERDELGGLKDILAGALGNAGIQYVADSASAPYLLKAALDADKLTTSDGWIWQRGTLRIMLLETASGKVIGAHQWPYKGSARQVDMVEIRTRAQLADMLAQDLLGVLVEFGDVADKKKD